MDLDLRGRTAVVTGCSVGIGREIARVRDEALARLGHADIVVNNAGGSRPTAVDAADDVWDESFELNFTAVRKLTRRAASLRRAY